MRVRSVVVVVVVLLLLLLLFSLAESHKVELAHPL